jgi:hypothetical protein
MWTSPADGQRQLWTPRKSSSATPAHSAWIANPMRRFFARHTLHLLPAPADRQLLSMWATGIESLRLALPRLLKTTSTVTRRAPPLRVGNRQPPSCVAPTMKDSDFRLLNNSHKEPPRAPSTKIPPPVPLRTKCCRHSHTAENCYNVLTMAKVKAREEVQFYEHRRDNPKVPLPTLEIPCPAPPGNSKSLFPKKGFTVVAVRRFSVPLRELL